ncbi:unnamed protein product [Amoebophrya sp. A120]|nr:unnamed protein product [Amoebophrya sp. A120]|eukprot:GSA120T00009380001.1
MAAASSSSAPVARSAGTQANVNADAQLGQRQPTIITADNVLVRYKGSFEKWGHKIADLDEALLRGKLRNIEKRTVHKMLASQVNIWYVLASRNIDRQLRPPLPEGVRRLIMQFNEDKRTSNALRKTTSHAFDNMLREAHDKQEEGYQLVLAYYLDKIHAVAAKGDFDEFQITDDVANAAPSLANGDRPRMDIIVAMLSRKAFFVTTADGNHVRNAVGGRQALPLPLTVRLGHGSFGHADRAADDVAAKVVDRMFRTTATTPEGLTVDAAAAPLWQSFRKTMDGALKKAADFLVEKLAASVATGVPTLVVTQEVMDQAPKLPNGEAVPLSEMQATRMHRHMDDSFLLLELNRRQKSDGFTIRYRRRSIYWWSDVEPLPFTLEVGHFPDEEMEDEESEGDDEQGEAEDE